MGWTSYFDNSAWTPDTAEEPCTCSWDGSEWDACEYGSVNWYWVYITVTGSWYSGYRPTKVKVTLSSDMDLDEFILEAPNGNNVLSETGTGISGTEYDITLASDIYSWKISTFGGGAFSVTNIEWYEEDATPASLGRKGFTTRAPWWRRR